jgi:hypothetical protein
MEWYHYFVMCVWLWIKEPVGMIGLKILVEQENAYQIVSKYRFYQKYNLSIDKTLAAD